MGKGMRAGKRPKVNGGGGFKMGGGQNQLNKLNAMQNKMTEIQDEIDQKEFQVDVGGGGVSLKIKGNKEVLSLDINDELIDKDEKEMLTDLLISAFNEANKKIDDYTKERMDEITGGLGI